MVSSEELILEAGCCWSHGSLQSSLRKSMLENWRTRLLMSGPMLSSWILWSIRWHWPITEQYLNQSTNHRAGWLVTGAPLFRRVILRSWLQQVELCKKVITITSINNFCRNQSCEDPCRLLVLGRGGGWTIPCPQHWWCWRHQSSLLPQEISHVDEWAGSQGSDWPARWSWVTEWLW